jgi:hypothetical protein
MKKCLDVTILLIHTAIKTLVTIIGSIQRCLVLLGRRLLGSNFLAHGGMNFPYCPNTCLHCQTVRHNQPMEHLSEALVHSNTPISHVLVSVSVESFLVSWWVILV